MIYYHILFIYFKNMQTKTNSDLSKIKKNEALDSNISKEKKIEFEKRRRNQIYKTLDYLLSNITYFNFFSADLIALLKTGFEISNFFEDHILSLDYLFLAYFNSEIEISFILNKFDISIDSFYKKNKNFNNLKSFFNQYDVLPNFKISEDVYYILKKAYFNTCKRFKTKLITPEILFITLMENNQYFDITKFIKDYKDQRKFYLLRYEIIKKIYDDETSFYNNVKKNQLYFGYLLRAQITNNHIKLLIKKNKLQECVIFFRNYIISKVLMFDISIILKSQLYKLLKEFNSRTYSN